MPIEWKSISRWLADATNIAVRESKELARKGKIQVDILGLKHQITRTLTELGTQTYQLLHKQKVTDVAADHKVQELVKLTHDLELKLRRAEKAKKTRPGP